MPAASPPRPLPRTAGRRACRPQGHRVRGIRGRLQGASGRAVSERASRGTEAAGRKEKGKKKSQVRQCAGALRQHRRKRRASSRPLSPAARRRVVYRARLWQWARAQAAQGAARQGTARAAREGRKRREKKRKLFSALWSLSFSFPLVTLSPSPAVQPAPSAEPHPWCVCVCKCVWVRSRTAGSKRSRATAPGRRPPRGAFGRGAFSPLQRFNASRVRPAR